ncbi:MAG: cytochrome c biogenesis protein CcsA [Pseudonocardiales bacterium]|nr:cytochrome c biogenesis protein CcsA [Pseudonocardiales bacterium]
MLAEYSDYAFRSALVVYLLAMAFYAAEFAASRTVRREPALVAAGGGELPDRPVDEPAPRSRAERFGRMAVALTILGALVHAGSVLARGLAAGRWPWGNMYEFASAICLVAVVAWLVVLRRQASSQLRQMGLFVLFPVVVLMFIGGTVLYAEAAPVVPALRSYWLAIHVSAIAVASGLLLVAGVASAMFLRRPTELLDRVAYRVTVVAFPIYTFAVIAGAIWAEAAWGRFWGWDPKETVAFVAWVIYAAYLHARATAGWRTRRAAWINVAGFAMVIFNLFFVNLVIAGLHSYAGV